MPPQKWSSCAIALYRTRGGCLAFFPLLYTEENSAECRTRRHAGTKQGLCTVNKLHTKNIYHRPTDHPAQVVHLEEYFMEGKRAYLVQEMITGEAGPRRCSCHGCHPAFIAFLAILLSIDP